MPSGGARQGTPGTKYPNRSDLTTPKVLPPTAAPGQTYGVAGDQRASQQVVPMGPPPAAAAAPGVPPASGLPPQPSSAPGSAPGPAPGAWGDFTRPSERPDEPLTAGLPTGPGPGPEALGFSAQPDTGAALLQHLGRTNPDIAMLANYAAGGRQ